ncbi:MAG: FAD-dependent oxidoreductase [Candidatus Micrarchaeia archaeon]
MPMYDLVAVGGGPAGIGAAFSAAKLGMRAAIIERHGMLGGNWTNAYALSMLGIYTYSGKTKIVGGIADEIIKKLKKAGGTIGKSGNLIPFRPAEMEYILGEMAKALNVDCYFSSLVTDAKMQGKKVKYVEISGKDGVKRIYGKAFADASGDADLAYRLHLKYMSGREGKGYHQETTLPFRIGGIKEKEFVKYAKLKNNLASINLRKNGDIDRLHILKPALDSAKKNGKLYLPHSDNIFMFNTSQHGEMVCNATHAPIGDFTDGKEISSVLEDLRRQAYSVFNFMKESIPGFEDSYIVDSASYLGLRETRRAEGEYVLTKEDVIENRRFEDAIARCGHAIEMHDPLLGNYYTHLKGGDDSWYQIPYRSIVVKGVDNLFAVGRCLSAEFEAQASARISGAALAMGQAAATAAYLSINSRKSANSIDVKMLQHLLKKNGAII